MSGFRDDAAPWQRPGGVPLPTAPPLGGVSEVVARPIDAAGRYLAMNLALAVLILAELVALWKVDAGARPMLECVTVFLVFMSAALPWYLFRQPARMRGRPGSGPPPVRYVLDAPSVRAIPRMLVGQLLLGAALTVPLAQPYDNYAIQVGGLILIVSILPRFTRVVVPAEGAEAGA